MQPVTITRWRTSDDKLWENEPEALAHEALLKERAIIVGYAQSVAPENTRNQARIVSTVEKYIAYRTGQSIAHRTVE